jgi:hypothetical protein
MKRKALVLVILGVCVLLVALFQWHNTINLKEELPVRIDPGSIISGKIRAFHPDLLYKKYRLGFVLTNKIMAENIQVKGNEKVESKEFYYYINDITKLTESEKMILNNESAQTYLKFRSKDGNYYLFVISGDHAGSANFRDIKVKLYKLKDGHYELIFNREETYSIDPGIDSNFFTERFKLLIIKLFTKDDRY